MLDKVVHEIKHDNVMNKEESIVVISDIVLAPQVKCLNMF